MSFPRPWIAFLSVMTVLPFCAQAYEYHRGPVERHVRAPCPGLYCGRRPLNETHVTGCGQCPRGWRVANNSHSLCEKCEDTPNLNEWLFMTFHGLFVLILHWMAIDFTTKRRNFTKEVRQAQNLHSRKNYRFQDSLIAFRSWAFTFAPLLRLPSRQP